jgi:hypothetical protein
MTPWGVAYFRDSLKLPEESPKFPNHLNFSGDSNGDFLESPDNTHQFPGESLNPS